MRNLLFGLFFFAITIVWGELPRTKTINQQTLTIIRDACRSTGDPLIREYYYEHYKGSSLRDEENVEEIFDIQGIAETFNTGNFVKLSVLGVIDVDLVGEDSVYLESAYEFLLNPNNTHGTPYLSIAGDVIPYLTQTPDANGNPSRGRKGLDMGYILENLATIVDMLWWYEGGIHQTDLAIKLDSLAGWVYERMQNNRPLGYEPNGPNGEIYPMVTPHNFSLRALGALGYAGVILENNDYLTFVDDQLLTFSWSGNAAYNGSNYNSYPWVENGLLQFNIQNSGIYAEGQGYMNFSFDGLLMYFTARNRYDNYNYYDHPIFRNMLEESINLFAPDFSSISFDDSWKGKISGSTNKIYFPCGFLEYVQQNDSQNDFLENEIRWMADQYLNKYNQYPLYKYDVLPAIFSYSSRDYTGGTIPQDISGGVYSNDEFTILRNPVNNSYDFQNSLSLWVNHENSRSCYGHEDDDQSSFILYYKGKNLLLDPGYQSGHWYGFGRPRNFLTMSHNGKIKTL